MSDTPRWTRKFSSASSFSDDLGSLGAWVGPRIGPAPGTHGQKEDYVLRRLLVARRRQKKLNFPFTVRASDQTPGTPDFVVADASSSWGLEVTQAGSERYQEQLTQCEIRSASTPTCNDLMPLDCGHEEIRRAIEKKIEKYNEGAYRSVEVCDLAVYDNTNSYSTGQDGIESVNEPCLQGRFRKVFFVRDRQVYTDVLSNRADFVDISRDYDIDFAEWIADQVNLLRKGDMTGLDVQQLIEEVSALAKSQRRALRSHLQVLFLHLLKWQYQPEVRSRSRKISINNARDEIEDLLMESPSLRDEFDDMAMVYRRARRNAAAETQLPIDAFPKECPFKPEGPEQKILKQDWFPF